MIVLLAFLYFLYAVAFFYTYKNGYSLAKYVYKRENINKYLSIEIFFLILTSFIVFTNQPLNWIIAILMIAHMVGVIWLVTRPDSYYKIADESMALDDGLMEIINIGVLFVYSALTILSRIIF
jgi:uncharacterized membrane protein